MNQPLTIDLELVEQTAAKLVFDVQLHNQSGVPLVLPFLNIYDLRFARQANVQYSKWYMSSTVSVDGPAGFLLEPGSTHQSDFQVRPCRFEIDEGKNCDDYHRYCVALESGEYLVWYQLEVDEKYFHLDTHARFEKLIDQAASSGAVAWKGRVYSNRLTLFVS